jgi:hypothetical protein
MKIATLFFFAGAQHYKAFIYWFSLHSYVWKSSYSPYKDLKRAGVYPSTPVPCTPVPCTPVQVYQDRGGLGQQNLVKKFCSNDPPDTPCPPDAFVPVHTS